MIIFKKPQMILIKLPLLQQRIYCSYAAISDISCIYTRTLIPLRCLPYLSKVSSICQPSPVFLKYLLYLLQVSYIYYTSPVFLRRPQYFIHVSVSLIGLLHFLHISLTLKRLLYLSDVSCISKTSPVSLRLLLRLSDFSRTIFTLLLDPPVFTLSLLPLKSCLFSFYFPSSLVFFHRSQQIIALKTGSYCSSLLVSALVRWLLLLLVRLIQLNCY